MKKKKTHVIFLVEDDQVFSKTLELHLKEHLKHKIEILTFSSGEDCLKDLHLGPIVIVLDYYLNSKNPKAANGMDILKKIKNIDPITEVIVLTREDNMNIALEIMNNGAFNYIIKNDIVFKRFQNIINTVIHQKKVDDIFKDFEEEKELSTE
ncbi:MAG TPA: response regulator [Bacteroidales bacterium]|nr:response regulator [Bacteroidales bacterium]HPS17198.1 response regulator [Bacteroidales bacterium]